MNSAIKTIKIHAISEVVSPLTHNAGTSGNETVVSMEPVLSGGAIRQVPIISGNAIRHRCIREPGFIDMIKTIGLYGESNVGQLNFLLNGGSLTESKSSDNMKTIATMQRLFPLVRLLGGCLPSQIISGSLICKRGILICEENRRQIALQVPDELQIDVDQVQGSETFIGKYQYTRGDASRHKDFSEATGEQGPGGDSDSNLMIYAGQTIIPGAIFYHGFILQNVSQNEFGALLHALDLWDASGATIGGSQRVGHGALATSLHIENDAECWGIDDSKAAYLKHVENNKDDCLAFLNEVFPK